MKVLENSAQFAEITASGVVLVDFYATWCGPCKMIMPLLEELSEEYEGKATILKVDTDEFGDIAQQYSVRSIPTLVAFKDGKPVGAPMVGAYPKEQYADLLDSLIE